MIQLGAVTLPDGLTWTDEFNDPPVEQPVRRRLDGGLALYPRALMAGRSITLETPADHPITRAQAVALAAMAATVGVTYSLTLRQTGFLVVFRHHDAPALDLTPLVDYADPVDTDYLLGTIKLLTL